MKEQLSAIRELRAYFENHPHVVMAFLFGSRAKSRHRPSSDWDIAVYFTPGTYGELEATNSTYPDEQKMWLDIHNIVREEADLVALNRARPSLVFSVLNTGIPLAVKDRKLYLLLLLKTHYDAVDFWRFTRDFWRVRERSRSLSPEDKAMLIEHLAFLENEFADLPKFQNLTWKEYQENRDSRRNVERWIENLVMASLDIAKIALASQKKDVPQTYAETLRTFAAGYLDSGVAERFASFAELRNIIAHEYLDVRWGRITNFLKEAELAYPAFFERARGLIAESEQGGVQ